MSDDGAEQNEERTVFIFEHFRDGMRAEDILITAGFRTRSGATPPDVRTGCDLAVSVPSQDSGAAETLLNTNGIKVMDVLLRFTGGLRELQVSKLVKHVDFGDYRMIRVGNMKLTFRRSDGQIVNISGGGCPDIPLLAMEMIGKHLSEVAPPAQTGLTLCAYTLQKAYEIALRQQKESS